MRADQPLGITVAQEIDLHALRDPRLLDLDALLTQQLGDGAHHRGVADCLTVPGLTRGTAAHRHALLRRASRQRGHQRA
ncbi:MAG: hypothetical protein EB084_20875 [Proteobacteria bacterium]|nr:hypothetical protein [Pseudomonadota bacterium]